MTKTDCANETPRKSDTPLILIRTAQNGIVWVFFSFLLFNVLGGAEGYYAALVGPVGLSVLCLPLVLLVPEGSRNYFFKVSDNRASDVEHTPALINIMGYVSAVLMLITFRLFFVEFDLSMFFFQEFDMEFLRFWIFCVAGMVSIFSFPVIMGIRL